MRIFPCYGADIQYYLHPFLFSFDLVILYLFKIFWRFRRPVFDPYRVTWFPLPHNYFSFLFDFGFILTFFCHRLSKNIMIGDKFFSHRFIFYCHYNSTFFHCTIICEENILYVIAIFFCLTIIFFFKSMIIYIVVI